MTGLQDLPVELLSLIAEELGGGELRKNVRNLTLCRKWYNAAFEVYRSGLNLGDINIYGCNINRLSDRGSYSGLRKLMHKNTRRLHVRLLGHWRDETRAENLGLYHRGADNNFGLFLDDREGIELGKRDREELDDDPYVFGQRSELEALTEWQARRLNPQLFELFEDLPRFTFLESLTFEAIQGTENNGSPIARYLTSTTMSSLLRNLSLASSLKRLTLDLCCELNYNGVDIHMCELLSKVLPRLEVVRLRLASICTRLFQLDLDLKPEDVKLKSMILKLHLPQFPASPASFSFKPKECDPPSQAQLRENRREDMIRAALDYVAELNSIRTRNNQDNPENAAKNGFKLFRISYVDSGPAINIVDCLTNKNGHPEKGWPPGEFFAYEDDGSPCWFEDEDDRLAWGGQFEFSQQPE